jgi:hypothetical protein
MDLVTAGVDRKRSEVNERLEIFREGVVQRG